MSYTFGTVTVTPGSATVTGTDTGWLTANVAGGFFGLDSDDGNPVPVAQIVSDTELTLVQPWRGSAVSGSAYWLSYDTRDGQQSVNNAQRLAEYIARLDSVSLEAISGLTPEADTLILFTGSGTATLIPIGQVGGLFDVQVPDLAAREEYDSQPEGFRVLVSDVGGGIAALYTKSTGALADWSEPAFITGPTGETGPIGPLMQVEAGTTTTLAAGSSATVTASYVAPDRVRLDFGIPRGVDGNGAGDMRAQIYDPDGIYSDVFDSGNQKYDNTDSGLSSSTVQGAINELAEGGGTDALRLEMMNFYSVLAMEQADRASDGPIAAGPDGNGIFDGFNNLSYVNLAQSSGLDTSVVGELKASSSQSDIYEGGLSATSNNYPNYNHRLYIAASEISTSGGRMRLRLEGPETGNVVISAIWFGHSAASGDQYDFDGGQVQLQVSGSNGFTIGTTSVWTDWFTFPLIPGRGVIISFHTTSGNIYRSASVPATKRWYFKEGGNESGVTNVSGYGESSSYGTALVSRIQIDAVNNAEGVGTNISLGESPDWGIVYAFADMGTASLNSDFRLALSRDGGATYGYFGARVLYSRPGGSAVITTDRVDLSVIPQGSSGRWRFNINNGKQVRVLAIGVMFGVDS